MHYLAVVLDLTGWRLVLRHSSELTREALLDALSKTIVEQAILG